MRTRFLPLLLLSSLAAAVEIGPQIGGYRRDGSGIFPDCAPPTGDLKQQWVTELPSWGHSSPIAIGDRILLTVEPVEGERDFPALVCLDAASGGILWDKPLDHLSAVPPGDAEPARAAWREVMADYAKRQAFCRDYLKTKDASALEAAGYEWNARWTKVIAKDETPIKEKVKIAKKAGFTLETWRHGCSGGSTACVGSAYATPVSDGRLIWSNNAWGGFFCHDLEGKLIWAAFSPGEAGEYCRNGRSPILWKNLLISDSGGLARAFDAASGKLLWSQPVATDTIVSPMVLSSGGRDILWAAGCKAFLLPEGTPLAVEGWKEQGMQTLVKYDERDVIFFCGSGEHCGWSEKGLAKAEFIPPAAVRFALAGGTLKATVLWNGRTISDSKEVTGGNKPWMTYFDKGFYHINGAIIDATTGKVRTGALVRGKGAAVPRTDHLLLVADGHVYGLSSAGLLSVYTTTGKPVSELKVVEPGEPKRICGADGPAFTLGKDRIYVRSNTHLHGIGR